VDPGFTGPHPPRTLGQFGLSLWQQVQSEYDVSDAAGSEMLAQACAALDRVEGLRSEINQDGEVLRKRGRVTPHPALRVELASRQLIVRTLARLGLDFEPVKVIGRPPGR
jgi:hypothetical protein